MHHEVKLIMSEVFIIWRHPVNAVLSIHRCTSGVLSGILYIDLLLADIIYGMVMDSLKYMQHQMRSI